MITTKKSWLRPQLVILGRGKPEERVLAACKDNGRDGPFIDQQQKKCQQNQNVCATIGSS